jgi:hypothetical protein
MPASFFLQQSQVPRQMEALLNVMRVVRYDYYSAVYKGVLACAYLTAIGLRNGVCIAGSKVRAIFKDRFKYNILEFACLLIQS